MEIWGYCNACSRWFYCSRVPISANVATAPCPVCLATPALVTELPSDPDPATVSGSQLGRSAVSDAGGAGRSRSGALASP